MRKNNNVRYIRLTDDQRAALKEALKKYSVSQTSVANAVVGEGITAFSNQLLGKTHSMPSDCLLEIYVQTGRPKELEFVLDYLSPKELDRASSQPSREGMASLETAWVRIYRDATGRLYPTFKRGSPNVKAAIVNDLEQMVVKYSRK